MFSCMGLCRAEWILLGTYDDDKLYINSTASEAGDGCSQIWVRQEFSKPQYYEKQKYYSSVNLLQFNKLCSKVRLVTFYCYSDKGSVVNFLDISDDPVAAAWNNIPPESTIDYIAKIVDKAKKEGSYLVDNENHWVVYERNSTTSTESKTREETTDATDMRRTVYVCASETSKRYHSDPDCSGLSNCTHHVEEMTVAEAEEMGKTPCRRCNY